MSDPLVHVHLRDAPPVQLRERTLHPLAQRSIVLPEHIGPLRIVHRKLGRAEGAERVVLRRCERLLQLLAIRIELGRVIEGLIGPVTVAAEAEAADGGGGCEYAENLND